ncbi:MAG: TlpA family protein disulfide reductase, partial [Flavobacterium sp.]
DNPKAFISILLVKQMFQLNKPVEEIKKHYDALDAEVKKTKEGKEVADMLKKATEQKANKGTATVGSLAPNFSAPDSEGKTVSLEKSLGKVTIIDFWASWCKPCRMENPNVVALFNEYNSKGLKIIGVSLDKDEIKWKDAIAADKLAWLQVSNLKQWDEPIAKLYGVEGIPATFILDASGKIVAKDLRGDQLKAKIKELLGA